MTRATALLLVAAAAALLSGCSTFNSLTGQTDNTVLPGQREDAIPGRTSFPENRDVAVGGTGGSSAPPGADKGGTETYCGPDDAGCQPPGSSGDVFSDTQ